MNTYSITYLWDESKWWVASVREVPGCHSQGRTIDQARQRVREALELFIDDAKSAALVDEGRGADL
jgi:predicted RNase H-like HicB family nuclease